MKRVLILVLLCNTSLDGWSQAADTTFPQGTFSNCWGLGVAPKADTIASHLLITHNPPSFGHSIEGYCVTSNGYCTGKHLVYRSKRKWFFGRRRWSFIVVGEDYDIWGCKRKEDKL